MKTTITTTVKITTTKTSLDYKTMLKVIESLSKELDKQQTAVLK
jgi:hypothetical protein